MSDHRSRVTVITGAGGGLGRAVALRMAAGGARLALSDINADGLAETLELVSASGATAVSNVVDLTSEGAVDAWREEIHAALGPVSILHNVAGIVARKMLDDSTVDDFRHVLEVNLVAPYACIRAFAPDMLAADWGRIVNVASIAGVVGYPFPAYGASKAGLINLSKSLLNDFYGTGITTNAVCPGAMDTPMLSRAALEKMVGQIPSGKVSPPEEIAATMDFLSSDDAASVNGATIVVDGGATTQFAFSGSRGQANS